MNENIKYSITCFHQYPILQHNELKQLIMNNGSRSATYISLFCRQNCLMIETSKVF